MTAAPTVLRIFVDQCVPDSAGRAFKEHGHDVVLLREKIAVSSPDPLVAAVAETNGAILTSLDGDFRQIAKRHGVGKRKFRILSLIKLSCREARCYERINKAMSLVIHEWSVAEGSSDRRLFVEIGDNVIRTMR